MNAIGSHRILPRTAGAPPRPVGRQIDLRALIGPQAFARLPRRVCARFAPHGTGAGTVVYRGIMYVVECSRLGRLIAHACRLVGRPVVSGTGRNVPCTVTLLPDRELGGTIWHRLYMFPAGSQTAATTKRAGDDGAAFESFSRCFAMDLDIQETAGELHFVAERYFAQLRGWRLYLPRWLSPGRLTVVHRDEGGGWFRFVMTLEHRLFGVLMYQNGEFFDPEE